MVIKLPFLETMITQVCNLSCHGCTNYSDLPHKGYVTWEAGRKQLLPWLEKISIDDFGIMGGEPLINPEVSKWLLGVRNLLPDSQIRFTTNGELLHKHFEILNLSHDIGNVVFKITVHRNSPELEEIIEKIFKTYNWEPVQEFGIDRFKTTNNLRLQINRPNKFIKTYKNTYADMEPHDSDPSEAFKICVQQKCPLLYNGKIYKCSTSGLLESTLAKFDWPNKNEWEPYLSTGIAPTDSDADILNFVNNFGKPEQLCKQCPSESGAYIDHIKTVIVK